MKNELITGKETRNILNAIDNLVSNVGLENPSISFNSKVGTASITGSRDGIQYTTTLKKQLNGVVQTTSQFATNLGRDMLISQTKELKKQGYTQKEIGTMLGISQPTVHNYLKK